MKRFLIATLGCKVNQYESQALREAWTAEGWAETENPALAGRILVNSCAVTAKAVSDVRNTIRRLHRSAPDAEIVVTGCAAQILAGELSGIPGVSSVIPQENKTALLGSQGLPSETLPPGKSSPFPPFAVTGYNRSRAVLKIQDGCSHGCAYCIVPFTRGKSRTRPFAESLAEARRLLDSGFREIVISGVNLRQYREGKRDFWDFVQGLEKSLAPEWAGRARFRISSLEPGQLTAKALETLATARVIAPHLHLSLQSGCASVLQRMGRGHYDLPEIPVFLERLRDTWPVFGLGADILTGFPGETEEEFAAGLAFCRSLPLTYAHVFPYSKRPGTAAAAFPGQVAHGEKKRRAAVLRQIVDGKKQEFLQSLIALPHMQVVFEARESGGIAQSGYCRGVNEFYADCRLEARYKESAYGGLTAVRATGVLRGALTVDYVST